LKVLMPTEFVLPAVPGAPRSSSTVSSRPIAALSIDSACATRRVDGRSAIGPSSAPQDAATAPPPKSANSAPKRRRAALTSGSADGSKGG
jgi:hypothetical protein